MEQQNHWNATKKWHQHLSNERLGTRQMCMQFNSHNLYKRSSIRYPNCTYLDSMLIGVFLFVALGDFVLLFWYNALSVLKKAWFSQWENTLFFSEKKPPCLPKWKRNVLNSFTDFDLQQINSTWDNILFSVYLKV